MYHIADRLLQQVTRLFSFFPLQLTAHLDSMTGPQLFSTFGTNLFLSVSLMFYSYRHGIN